MLQANFHTTLAGEAMVTLIYHKKLEEEWKTAARELRDALGSLPGCTSGTVQARCSLMSSMSLDHGSGGCDKHWTL